MADKSEQIEENLVKKTCRELGITQKELAEKIGVSKTTVSDWSNEKTPIPKWGRNSLDMIVELKEVRAIKESIQTLSNSDMRIRISQY
jgi:transcriptional regulator with XRE-family HTH domain